MPRFYHYDYNQSIMLAINLEDQVQAGTIEHTIHYLIEHKLDLSPFYVNYHNDETGRPAYDPAILLKVVLFAYYKGITSSREIDWQCRTNIIFKALACDSEPHWTTIAWFVSGQTEAILSIFEQILLVCDQQGLLGHELLAIDGCKMSSDAAKEWSGTLKELEGKQAKLRRQISHHIDAHKREDAKGDDDQSQRRQQAINTLNLAAEKIENFLETAEPRMGKGKRPKEVKSNITDNESAKMTTSKGTIQGYNGVATVDKKHQIIVDATAFGEGQEHHCLQPVLEQLNKRYAEMGICDDLLGTEVIVTADTGFANEANMQYLHDNDINGYIPDNQFRSRDPKFDNQKDKHPRKRARRTKKNVIPASEFDFDPIEQTCICPDGKSMWLKNTCTSQDGKPTSYFEGRLTDCRSCSKKEQCMRNPTSAAGRKGHGRQVSFALNDKRKPTFTDWMKHRVDSDYGKQVYGHRMSVVEPVFGNMGSNKRLNRFSLRGKKKVNAQWQLYCSIHNIEKLTNYSDMTT